MTNYKTIVYLDAANEWRWRTKAPNNEIVSTSGEGYKNQSDCLDMATRMNLGIDVEVVDDTE